MFGLFKKKNTEEDIEKNEPGMDNHFGEEITNQNDNSISNSITPKVWRKNSVYQEPETIKEELIKVEVALKEPNLESLVGKLVICLNENLENPTVGVAIEIIPENNPVLSVYDIVRKETISATGVVFLYTEQKFDGLNQIDANTRIALFFDRLSADIVKKKQHASRPLVSSSEWKKQVLEAIERINRGEWT